jgi:putative (di)nucleoside polyphosphate hydrolase
MDKFRRGIVAVLRNQEGLLLLCERADHPGAWQFPQGGIEPGESPGQAFLRELEEELGNGACRVLREGDSWARYEWPQPGRDGKLGQEQRWFLGEFVRGAPELGKSDGSFRAWKWVSVGEALAAVVDWKRPAYRVGLASIGIREKA